ncbi:MFS transporter [Rothia koreensis]|uniref:MFS transporter n=1 Tax=Rothia koreensis TaxID=592378 RepID=UPI003F1EA487
MPIAPKRRTERPALHDRRWLALAALMSPVLLVSVDNTVLSFALPPISAALNPTGTQLLWIVDIYSLVLAGLLVPMGSFGDRIGRRRLLMIGATGFTVISVAAAFAPSAAWLITARAAMGLFGSVLMPATLSLIRNIFIDPNERRKAIAIWASGFSGGAALGPIVGGFLLEHFYWGSIFLMAVPMLVPFLIFARLLIPESRDPHPSPIDITSIVLVMATMTPLVYGIKSFASHGLGTAVIICFAVTVLAGVWFVRRQLRRPDPMLDVRLFTNSVFSGAVGSNLLSVFSLVGFLYFVSQHLQLISGMTPMEAGVALIPGLGATIVAGLAVVPVVRRFKPAHVVATGLFLNAIGFGVMFFAGPAGSDAGLILAFVILGIGIGSAETISNDLILDAVPAHKAGSASAISETAYETGAVLGTAVLGSILNATYRANVSIPVEVPEASRDAARETLGGATDVAAHLGGPAGESLLHSARAAFDSGVGITSGMGVVLMLGAVLMALRTLRDAKS